MLVTLRFIAREDALATVPGSRANLGQPAWYIGRRYSPPDAKIGKAASYPATKEPYEVTLDLAKQDDSIRFNRFVKIAKRFDIWPFDAETAKLCDVPLPTVVFKDDEWRVPLPPAPHPPGESTSTELGAPALSDVAPPPPVMAADEPPPAASPEALETALDEKASAKTKKRS